MVTSNNVLDDKLHWYKDAIIYELHIKAFRDGNNDGIGDFEGLLEKLDYLEDLGVTAIWLLPFYPSPLRDDGYDIADYYHINPLYGNINQFKRLLREAHKRNLKVITELVINHTSDQHPWFQRARKSPKGSVHRDYYVWSDDPHKYKDVRIIFQDFEASNWTWDSVAQQYYWHRFFYHQPDLNYDNPKVQEEVFKIIDYWCKLGVDGFRLDAVPYLFEREGTNGENLPETHVFLKKLRKHVDENFPGTVLLAEANMWPEDAASYFGDGDECHMNYHFPVMPRIFMSLQMEGRYPITDIFDQTPAIPDNCQWAIFLRNHDELTLEMVTDEERDYMYKVYAKDPKAKINLGIRHRLAPLMENNRRKIELLNCLLFSLPGTPVLYYGDEIGMGDNVYLGDRDGVRTPMQWSPDRNAGFSESNPQKLYLPVILDPEYHYEAVNVETQHRNTSSLLWYMKRLINMRKKHKAFSRGEMKFVNVENSKVLAFTRTYGNEIMLVIANLSRYSQPAELDLGEYRGYHPVEVFSKNKFPAIHEDSLYFFTLDSYAFQWFLLKKTHPDVDEQTTFPLLRIGRWKDLIKNEPLEELENSILPDYFLQTKWFDPQDRLIQRVNIVQHAALPVPDQHTFTLLAEVTYKSELPEIYQLSVCLVKDDLAKKIMESSPQAIICRIQAGEEEGYLCDALFTQSMQNYLIERMARGHNLPLKASEICYSESKQIRQHLMLHPETKAKVISDKRNHTSINYDNRFFLKIYRHVDYTLNPDAEITRYLSRQKGFGSFPRLIGLIDWKLENGNGSIMLGMMQEIVENHGDGRTYMGERMNDFIDRVLTIDRDQLPYIETWGTLLDPVAYENIPDKMKELMEGQVAEAARLIGVRTGEMHNALAAGIDETGFAPENFSLHYQRSLYSGFQSLVRAAYSAPSEALDKMSPQVRSITEDVLSRKEEVLNCLKKIYKHKIDATKIRIHGNYHLEQLLYTGRDVSILHFGGDLTRSFSERLLKRSPLRDVAGMLRSFHYAAYESLRNNHDRETDFQKMGPYARLWVHYISGFFMHAYLDAVQGSSFIPNNKEDLGILLETFLMEKAVFSLNYELRNRPEWAVVPARIIQDLLAVQE